MPFISLYDDDDMEETAYTIIHACGSDMYPHTSIVYLSDVTLVAAREETLKVLRRSWCPTCHRRQRRLVVRQKSYSFGLVPLNEPDLDRLELAEEVRVRLVQSLTASQTNPQASKMLVLLINRCIETNFWIEHRMILWDNLGFDAMVADLRTFRR